MANEEKLSYIESFINEAVENIENENYRITDEAGEKFIKDYLEVSKTMELDAVTRMRFVIICINEIPTLVFKNRGLITADEFNKEIDLYVGSLDQQTKVQFIQLLLKDGYGAVYDRDTAEMMDNFSKSINDTNTNWHAICEHIEGIGEKLGLVEASETPNNQGMQQSAPTSNSQPQKSGGCYVATAVYGSYDCPQVWTLRRFRDYKLAKSWQGRLFIKTYYLISPTIVSLFGDNKLFKCLWRRKLDQLVKKLQDQGVESTFYEDIPWK